MGDGRSQSRDRPWFLRWYGIVGIVFTVIGTVPIVLRMFVFQSFNAPSGSMRPALEVGDHFFVDKRAYGYGPYSFPFGLGAAFWSKEASRSERTLPARGDVVVFRLPSNTRIGYVKRVIGISGDRVQLKSGRVYLNGMALRVRRDVDMTISPSNGESRTTIILEEFLPSGKSYIIYDTPNGILADNTEEFLVPDGHFFVLGDNRDNSADSRFMSQVGFIPVENLIGRATLIFGSRHNNRRFTWVQ